MDRKIDIKFCKPGESVRKDGTLIIEEFGKNMIEFKGDMLDPFEVIDVIFAEAVDSEVEYTLVNCVFSHSVGSNFCFTVNELYQGVYLSKVTTEDCVQSSARVTGLTRWINQSRIKPTINFDVNEPGNVLIQPPYERIFSINNNISIRLEEYCYEQLQRDGVILENRSQYFVEAKLPISRMRMFELTFAFQKLLSLFTEYIPRFTGLELELVNENYIACLAFKPTEKLRVNDALLDLLRMSDYFDNMLFLFYARLKDYVQVIDLLNESIKNKTSEISFLNLTTALEVFHKNFMEDGNTEARDQVAYELEQVGLKQRGRNEWNQIMRYHHLFQYMNNISFVPQIVTDELKMIELIKDSRNYYTHYSETKRDIWTPNQLVYSNMFLRQLVKGVIVKSLQLPDDLVNRLLNNQFATISHRYDKNEYSMNFKVGVN